jgi:hypothetical protein
MNKINYLFLLTLVFFVSCTSKKAGTVVEAVSEWTNLLDENLSQWRIYQSYENMDSNGKPVEGSNPEPIGYDVNKDSVFSVIKENNELLLHVNGKTYGCVFTKQSYRNYHLKLQYKFGTDKYPPRTDKAMDSGILYHSQGDAGVDYWHSWMLGQEFQVMEAGTDEGVSGDYWSIANAQVWIRASNENSPKYLYNPEADLVGFGAHNTAGHCAAGVNYTSPAGEWTTLELICYEGKSLHIVNGKVAMALEKSSCWNGTESVPLVEGKIQLQSESAEIFYKDIQIKEINELPAEYIQ